MDRRRRIQVASIITGVLALHLSAIWFLMARSRVFARRTDSGGFEIVLIAPTAPPEQTSPEHEASHANSHRGASVSRAPIGQQAPPEEQSNAIHPPIDWAGELSRAAKNATADKSAQLPRDFGLPHAPPPRAQAPQFDWDHAATQRLETIPGGGLLLNLNDRCVLVFMPFPFPFCGIGHQEANGDLFKHRGDPAGAQPGSAP
jgi:hypothetical protein